LMPESCILVRHYSEKKNLPKSRGELTLSMWKITGFFVLSGAG